MVLNLLTILIAVIVLVSIAAFNNPSLLERFLYMPYRVKHNREHYRLGSHVFIHADWGHLIFNMLSLYFLGNSFLYAPCDYYVGIDCGLFATYGSTMGSLHFVALFVLGGLFATLIPYIRNQDNPSYRSLGASGAVSAVIFAAILWNPGMKLMFFFIPIAIPAYVFGPVYLLYEYFADKRGGTGIAHDAHIGGALFGIVYVLIINVQKGGDFVGYFLEFFK
jgi:membrane associated rhomboid family serine protease